MKPEMTSKAHVPKLLLTQAIQFQKDNETDRNKATGNLQSLDSRFKAGQTTNADSLMINSPNNMMFGSQESPMMRTTLGNDSKRDTMRVASNEDVTTDGQMEIESPTKLPVNPIQTYDQESKDQLPDKEEELNQVQE